jgi:hypothetical protein
MQIIMPLILITVGLTLILKYVVTPRYGDDVRARFLERFNYIPSRCSVLTQGTLAAWLDDKSNEEAKAGYSFPVFSRSTLFSCSVLASCSDLHRLP